MIQTTLLQLKQKTTGALAKCLVLFFACLLLLPFLPTVARGGETVEYTVKFKDTAGEQVLNSIGLNAEKRFGFTDEDRFKNIYSFESDVPESQLRSGLAGLIEYLEPVTVFQVQAVITNDPGFTQNTNDIDKQWGLIKTSYPTAWEKSTGSKKNIVGIIDTGIDATHEDLQAINMVYGFNFISRQPINGNVNSDDNGHGTLVTGVLGSTVNNGKGVAGTNWNISVMPLKALDAQGRGDSTTIAEAMVWAADKGANIINLSLGGVGFGHDTTLANVISYAFKKGVVIVAAAGNDVAATGGNLDIEPVYPICNDNDVNMVIGVAATDHNDLKGQFSNYGKNCIDVTAPGKRILSTINYDPVTNIPAPNSYAYASGTSLAAPFVTGQVALIKSLYPNATNVEVRDRILATADPIDPLNLSQCAGKPCRGLLGTGRINVLKSIETELGGSISEGDIVQAMDSDIVYYISGAQKRIISPFVFNQRFAGVPVKKVPSQQLDVLSDGPYATPIDGTLVKLANNPTVYYMSKGYRLPVTYQVFTQRKFDFNRVSTVSYSELNSWIESNFLPPEDGVLLRTAKNRTVFWVVGGVLHPVNQAFYLERGLNIFPVQYISDEDLAGYPKGEPYIR